MIHDLMRPQRQAGRCIPSAPHFPYERFNSAMCKSTSFRPQCVLVLHCTSPHRMRCAALLSVLQERIFSCGNGGRDKLFSFGRTAEGTGAIAWRSSGSDVEVQWTTQSVYGWIDSFSRFRSDRPDYPIDGSYQVGGRACSSEGPRSHTHI